MARIRNGIASIASVTRLMTASTQLPLYPASSPIGTPSSSAIEIDTTPASIEARAPKMTRANKSRPDSSVPNQCCGDGGLRISVQLCCAGS